MVKLQFPNNSFLTNLLLYNNLPQMHGKIAIPKQLFPYQFTTLQ